MLTVVFSWQAARSANGAKKAAEFTRHKLQSLDLLNELNRLQGRVDDLTFRLEAENWIVAAERATDLRVSLAAVHAVQKSGLSDDVKGRILVAVNQFKNIASGSDRAHSPEKNTPDATRYRALVATQKETIVLAIQEVKTMMGKI